MLRREFLITPGLAYQITRPAPLRTFSKDDAALVEALCEAIIPVDTDPGARRAGVLYYIDEQLAGPLQRFIGAYRQSLPLFQSACREKTGRSF
jgi:hypothetical protein